MTTPAPPLRFYATPTHPCGYLSGREARTVFVDPDYPKSPALHDELNRFGFRRSGSRIYRPVCPHCRQCVPIRIPVARFRPRRIHRRILAANRDLTFRTRRARFDPAHFALYRRYLSARHAGGGMDDPSPAQYRDFLISTWSDTVFFEYSLGTDVLAVSVVDRLADAFSCVYSFFDPAHARRSLGSYAILHAIDSAHREAREWLYLGYYIAGAAKMRYKADYRPHERFIDGRWTAVE